MENSKLLPILHWAGGKRQLLPEIRKRMPEKFNDYYEPFLGGGAVLFDLQPERAFINDANHEIWNLYFVIKWHHLFLIDQLNNRERFNHSEECFYRIRAWDQDPRWKNLYYSYERAARTLYLNKACFNGLYRLNKAGHFNAPWGFHAKESDYQFDIIKLIHQYFNSNQITITNHDFMNAVSEAEVNDFVYFDPPYDKKSKTAKHTAYTAGGFNRDDQKRLLETVKRLTDKGVYCMVSNAATDFILDLWVTGSRFKVDMIHSRCSINSDSEGRGKKLQEVIITNY